MVVIILAFVVIFASIAIYYLLRNREPSSKERAARRKHSIRKEGATHTLPIGLPSSFSQKIGNMFKGRRSDAGWVPANDEADEWDSKDEPVNHLPDLPYDPAPVYYPRVGSAPPSQRATLTEPSESHKSRMASHVEDTPVEDFGSYGPPPPPPMPMPPTIVHAQAPSAPDEVWLNDPYGRGGLGSVGTANHMGYHAPQPRRADSGPEIPLFAGSTPFR